MKTHLITGASSGLGAEFVKRLAEKYPEDRFLLVARREERMRALAEALHIDAEIFPADLEDPADVKRLALHLQDLTLGDVVLAAGYGIAGTLRDHSYEDAVGMVDLNVRALTALTHAALPEMESGSTLYLFASVAGFLPQPHLAIYAATKAYVLSFARAISREERKRGIHVIAICPNPVKTEFLTGRARTRASISSNPWGLRGRKKSSTPHYGVRHVRKTSPSPVSSPNGFVSSRACSRIRGSSPSRKR